MVQIKVQTIADDLVAFLEENKGQHASVHSVFPRAVNFLAGDELITLTSHGDLTPMGVVVDGDFAFPKLLKIGDEFLLESDKISATDASLQLIFQEAHIWQTDILVKEESLSIAEIEQKRIEIMEWLETQEMVGLLPLLGRLTGKSAVSQTLDDNVYTRYIADDLAAFTGEITISAEAALERTDKLVGFGMGSTPSCDDFLAAYLAVFRLADALHLDCFAWVSEFNQTVAEKAKKQSPFISAIMLRHAADGKMSRAHQSLIRSCFFRNHETPVVYANQVIRYGATSGSDFLLGLVCALDWYKNALTDLTKEGEEAWATQTGSPCK